MIDDFMYIKDEIDKCENMDDVVDMQHDLAEIYISFPEMFTTRMKKLVYYYIKDIIFRYRNDKNNS